MQFDESVSAQGSYFSILKSRVEEQTERDRNFSYLAGDQSQGL